MALFVGYPGGQPTKRAGLTTLRAEVHILATYSSLPDPGTLKAPSFVNTTAIAYQRISRLQQAFCLYAKAVVFTTVRTFRVLE